MVESGDPGDRHEPAGKISLWQRFLLALPSARRDETGERIPFGERFRNAVLKAEVGETSAPPSEKPQTVEELEAAVRYADDTERLIGLIAAPLAAAITLVVVSNQISTDPRHTATYHTLELVFLVMAAGLMAAAWFRKRLFMGILLALFGLGVFNLHYWEFGIPFVLAGAWYLVRAYRAQRALKEATTGGSPTTNGSKGGARPTQSKRYTPPTPSRRPKPQKPQDKRQAG
ncbi:MAG TPA: hypothetical protein VEI83_03225 [Acidimicrobiales bacterium]|nr:hypothetical protein [Acidimicrobiales bacterium]